MTWLAGIDEAGYGPNLGPLVMSVVALAGPVDAASDLWTRLTPAVRRAGSAGGQALLIDDSKKVYAQRRGLADLEAVVWALRGPFSSLRQLLTHVAADSLPLLEQEVWFHGRTTLPLFEPSAAVTRAFHAACQALGWHWAVVRSVIVATPQFNSLVRADGTKAAVTSFGLGQLLRELVRANDPAEPIDVRLDKQGGRQFYAPLLASFFPESWVEPIQETARESRYRWTVGSVPLTLTVRPRSDSDHLVVAVASMLSKYLREVLMREFNAFWQREVPELPPTAGYPADAVRYLTAIRPAMRRLALTEDQVWRHR